MFGRTKSPSLRDKLQGDIVSQSQLAVKPPDVGAIVKNAIEQSGRSGVDRMQVHEGLSRVVIGQLDAYATGLGKPFVSQVREMREILFARSDFRFEMLFAGLTYLGPQGVAVANSLTEQTNLFAPELVELIAEGKFDSR